MALHLGVRYVYGAASKAAVREPLPTLRPEDLAALPAALRGELEDAVISLDPARIAFLVSQVSEQTPPLGVVLGRLANKLAYSRILYALRS